MKPPQPSQPLQQLQQPQPAKMTQAEKDLATAQRYFESFQVPEMDEPINPNATVLEGVNRIKIIGQFFEGRPGQNPGDYNGHYLEWKLIPQDG